MMNYTMAQEMAINDYLTTCIKNNYLCEHCIRNHNGICFFAFQCFANGMMCFDGDDEENYNISNDVDETNYNPYMGCDDFEIENTIDLDEWSNY